MFFTPYEVMRYWMSRIALSRTTAPSQRFSALAELAAIRSWGKKKAPQLPRGLLALRPR